ncbi:hypothetical protein HMI56_007628 [Coelomomyces lativittatus]|nr:hypothetical protein HMI56_007628 [Coelomomyces lativittatus]
MECTFDLTESNPTTTVQQLLEKRKELQLRHQETTLETYQRQQREKKQKKQKKKEDRLSSSSSSSFPPKVQDPDPSKTTVSHIPHDSDMNKEHEEEEEDPMFTTQAPTQPTPSTPQKKSRKKQKLKHRSSEKEIQEEKEKEATPMLNLQDPRFSPYLFSDPLYAIDPTHSQYKPSLGMSHLLSKHRHHVSLTTSSKETQDHRVLPSPPPSSSSSSSSSPSPSLMELVSSVKSKSKKYHEGSMTFHSGKRVR